MTKAKEEPARIEVSRQRHNVHASWIIEAPAREGDPCELIMIVEADGTTRLSSENGLAYVITPDTWLSLLAAECPALSDLVAYYVRACRLSRSGGVANVYATERDGDDGLLLVIQRDKSGDVDVHKVRIDRDTAINRNTGLRFFRHTHDSDAMELVQSMGSGGLKKAAPSLLGLTPGATATQKPGADRLDYRACAWDVDMSMARKNKKRTIR